MVIGVGRQASRGWVGENSMVVMGWDGMGYEDKEIKFGVYVYVFVFVFVFVQIDPKI
jgi:hypothetical protein